MIQACKMIGYHVTTYVASKAILKNGFRGSEFTEATIAGRFASEGEGVVFCYKNLDDLNAELEMWGPGSVVLVVEGDGFDWENPMGTACILDNIERVFPVHSITSVRKIRL